MSASQEQPTPIGRRAPLRQQPLIYCGEGSVGAPPFDRCNCDPDGLGQLGGESVQGLGRAVVNAAGRARRQSIESSLEVTTRRSSIGLSGSPQGGKSRGDALLGRAEPVGLGLGIASGSMCARQILSRGLGSLTKCRRVSDQSLRLRR